MLHTKVFYRCGGGKISTMAAVSISSGCWFHHWKMELDWTTRCGPCRRQHKGFFSSSNFISREGIEDVSQSYQTIFIFKRGKKKQLGQPSRCVVEVSIPNMGTFTTKKRFWGRGLKCATIGLISLRPHFLNRGPRPGPIATVKMRPQTDQV